jgi:N utilization substance protein A
VEELNGERIDIVRWNDSLQILVPNALQPAEVEDVILCPMLGKVLVLVNEDQLSLAIGRRGQNVRLASKLVGWDINVMTQESLDEQLDISIEAFSVVPEMDPELVENLVSQGFFTFDDLSVIEPDQLADLGGLTQEQCDTIVDFADVESLRIEEEERLAAEERKRNPPPPPAVVSEEVKPREPESIVAAEPEGGSAEAEESDDSSESSGAKSAATVDTAEEMSDAGVSVANDVAHSSLADSEEDSLSGAEELEKTSDDSESTS